MFAQNAIKDTVLVISDPHEVFMHDWVLLRPALGKDLSNTSVIRTDTHWSFGLTY